MGKIICLFVTACAFAALVGFITSFHSLGLTEDCLRYLSMAHHVAAGKGFAIYNPSVAPISLPHISQAPLWSALIAPGLAAGWTAEAWTWSLVTILLGANLFLAGWLALHGTRSMAAGLAVQALLLSDGHWLKHHAYALSEPFFLFVTLSAVFCLWLYLDSGRVRWLVAATVCAGLAGLTRFVGLAYPPAFALAVLWLDRSGRMDRLWRAAGVVFWGTLPLGLWFLRHYWLRREWFGMHVAESETGRFFPLECAASFVRENLRYPLTSGWLPDRAGYEWVFPLLGIAALFFCRAHKHLRESRSHWIFPLTAVVYSAMMILVWSLRSVRDYPDAGRLSLPMMTLLWIWGLVVFWTVLSDSLNPGPGRPFTLKIVLARGACVAIVLWAAAQAPLVYGWMVQSVQTGAYGRPDQVSWNAANRIAWFPRGPS